MAVLKVPALLLAISLTSGHRIQPSSIVNRKAEQDTLSHENQVVESPSSPQRNPSTLRHEETLPVLKRIQKAFENTWHVIMPAKNSLYLSASTSMLLALGLLFGVASCVVQVYASHLPRKKTRIPYLLDGRVVYEWSQLPHMVTIFIRPPKGTRRQDLEVTIASRRLTVGRKDKPFFLREETYDVVDVKKSSWSLRSNGEIQVYLKKKTRAEWPSLFIHKETPIESKFRPAPSTTHETKGPLAAIEEEPSS